MNRSLSLAFVLSLLLAAAPGDVRTQEPGSPRPRVWEKGERERIEAWESLSPEQREKLREALRQVWADPAVINAREEIKHASDAYQAAIKSAVERADPSVAGLLAKVQGAGGMAPDRGGPGMPGSPGGGPMPMRGFDEQIRPPGFFDSLSPEEREKFRKTEEAAMKAEVVKAARGELARIREEDEALRRKRLEAHRQLRKVTVEEMIRIDPSIAAIQKRLLSGDRNGSPEKKKDGEGKDDKPADPVSKVKDGDKKSESKKDKE